VTRVPPIADASKRRPFRANCVQGVRVALVAAMLLAIPSPAETSISDGSTAPSLAAVQYVVSNAAQIAPQANAAGLWPVHDAGGATIALAARTLPAAKDEVGYRGPTEAMIIFDPALQVVSVRLLSSADTTEHVGAVVADEMFFEQFSGWSWGGPEESQRIDAVSGATLTSLALAEGVLTRIGGARPSLVFPKDLAVEDVAPWFPEAASLSESRTAVQVHDADGNAIGRVLRSGKYSDDVIGYQGPTELLLVLAPDDQLRSVRLRSSYDNEPYVDYVRVEAGFWALFENQSIDDLAAVDPQQAGIEGVSGATMTSLAVADTIVATAKAIGQAAIDAAAANQSRKAAIRWTAADIATIVTLMLAAILSHFRWFRHRTLRTIWLVGVVLVVGGWAGNLISLALVAGWSAEGVAWRLAPGLSAIAAVALLAPPLTKGNPYCNHLCPHGALQQLVRPRRRRDGRKRQLHLGAAATRWLSRIPGLSLAVAYIAVVVFPWIDLSTLEPFHAYLFRIAGWGAILFCLATLAIATVIPMGYCRLGCPTGRLIDYLRRTAVSDRIGWADSVAVGLLLFAVVL
jgi:NosR/NirI family nitrous oxide reductase transcriptional regulator